MEIIGEFYTLVGAWTYGHDLPQHVIFYFAQKNHNRSLQTSAAKPASGLQFFVTKSPNIQFPSFQRTIRTVKFKLYIVPLKSIIIFVIAKYFIASGNTII